MESRLLLGKRFARRGSRLLPTTDPALELFIVDLLPASPMTTLCISDLEAPSPIMPSLRPKRPEIVTNVMLGLKPAFAIVVNLSVSPQVNTSPARGL